MDLKTNYEKWYEGDEYYWGTEPGSFLDELIDLCPPSAGKKVLDIGCGGVPHYHCMDTIICRKTKKDLIR